MTDHKTLNRITRKLFIYRVRNQHMVRTWVAKGLRSQWRSYHKREDDLFRDPAEAFRSFCNIYNDMASA